MHDAKGRPLNEGDTVLIPATVTSVSPGADYCNVTLRSQVGRRPDGLKEAFSAINTGVLFRNNAGDDNADMYSIVTAAELQAAAAEETPGVP